MNQLLPIIDKAIIDAVAVNTPTQVRVHLVKQDAYVDCYIMPLTHEYVSVVTQVSHDEAQRRHLEHHARVKSKFMKGGGIDTVDPRFPVYPHIVHFLRDHAGSVHFTKNELWSLIQNREYSFSTVP